MADPWNADKPEELPEKGRQIVAPDGDGLTDTEADEVAGDAGDAPYAGPEAAALHVETDEEGGGRVGDPDSGYLDEP